MAHTLFSLLNKTRALRARPGFTRSRSFVKEIGPELVAGASDSDPTNIGTATIAGARSPYRLAWVAVLIVPLLAVVQRIAAQLGSSAHDDLPSLVRTRYGRRVSG